MSGCLMPGWRGYVWLVVIAVGLVLGGGGCKKADYSTHIDAGSDNLAKVGAAYMRAVQKAVDEKKPLPRRPQDLDAFLKEHGDPAALLRSPNDGEPYVILWGVNPFDPAYDNEPVIIIYEKKGKDGRRYVISTRDGRPTSLSDVEFSNEKFPAGHRPPS